MALHVRIRRSRPRVCVSEDNLPIIKKRIETTHVEEWSQLVVWSRGIAKTPADYRLRAERLSERGKRLAFMFAVRQDEKDLEFALEIMPKLTEAKPTPAKIEAIAQLYDSLRDKLPAKLADTSREVLLSGARKLFEEHVRGAPVLTENRSRSVSAVFAAGLALYGDADESQKLLAEAVHASRDLTGTLMYFLEEDGGMPLGWAQSFVHLGQLPKLALLAESGLAQSWPREAPWMERYVEFLDTGIRPGGFDDLNCPIWVDGGRTVLRLDLWRVLATVAGFTGNATAIRLLKAIPLNGCQDEKILYEVRDHEHPDAKGKESEIPPVPLARFFRRAGVAMFRGEEKDGDVTEVVVRCPVSLVSGFDTPKPGDFSFALGQDIIVGGSNAANTIVIGASRDASGEITEPSYPRTRREINSSENRRSEVLACDPIGTAGEWMMVDLARDHRSDAESVIRLFVFMRDLPAWRWPVLVVYDDVRLKTPGGDVATTIHLSEKPDILTDGVACEVGDVRMRNRILLPTPFQLWLDEPIGASADRAENGQIYRLKIGSKEAGARNTFCQVIMAGPTSVEDDVASRILPSAGATILEVAGRGLVIAREDAKVVEGVAMNDLDGVSVVGVAPSVTVTLEVSGSAAVGSEASDSGALHFAYPIPGKTGFRISIDAPDDARGNRRISMRRRAVGGTSVVRSPKKPS